MSENKWHNEMDDWLKDSLEDLPNPRVSDWGAFETNRQQTNKKKGLLWFSSALAVLLLWGVFNDYSFKEDKPVAPTEIVNKQNPKTFVTPKTEATKPQNIEQQAAHDNAKSDKKLAPQKTLAAQQKGTKNNVENSRTQLQATFNNHVKTANAQVPVAQDWAASPFAVEPFNTLSLPDFEEEPEPETYEYQEDLVREVSFALILDEEDSASKKLAESNPQPEEGLFEDNRFSVTIGMYPNYTFRDLKIRGTDENMVHKDFMKHINESEKGGMAFNVGAEVKYKIGKDLFLGSGLYFMQTKITGAYDFAITENPLVDPNTGAIIGYKPAPEGSYVNVGIINSYNYLQVPLVISYQPWINKKLRMVVEGGTSYLRFLKAEGTTLDFQNLRPVNLAYLDYNKNMFTINFKIGVNYYLNQQLALGLEPTFMYFSNSIYADNYPINMVPWSIGVNFNMKVRLQ